MEGCGQEKRASFQQLAHPTAPLVLHSMERLWQRAKTPPERCVLPENVPGSGDRCIIYSPSRNSWGQFSHLSPAALAPGLFVLCSFWDTFSSDSPTSPRSPESMAPCSWSSTWPVSPVCAPSPNHTIAVVAASSQGHCCTCQEFPHTQAFARAVPWPGMHFLYALIQPASMKHHLPQHTISILSSEFVW